MESLTGWLYLPDGTAVQSGRDEFARADMAMAKETLRILKADFPGYNWVVEADCRQGIVKIRINARFMPAAAWYVIHTDNIATTNAMGQAVREAGGHLLERYRLRRSGIWLPEYRDLVKASPIAVSARAKVPE